jgi:hypothetical protein
MARSLTLIAGGALVFAGLSAVCFGQTKSQEKSSQDGTQQRSAQDQSPEMADAMQAMMPSEAHEKLGKLQGKWNVKSTIVIAGMDPQEPTEGTAELIPILGGRFIQETGDGMMMGFPVQHVKIWGYNNGSKKYQALWMYTMSTGFLNMEGTSADQGKTIQWKGYFDNEVGIREELTAVTKYSDDDHFEIELVGGKMPDGTDGPRLKAVYTRAK